MQPRTGVCWHFIFYARITYIPIVAFKHQDTVTFLLCAGSSPKTYYCNYRVVLIKVTQDVLASSFLGLIENITLQIASLMVCSLRFQLGGLITVGGGRGKEKQYT